MIESAQTLGDVSKAMYAGQLKHNFLFLGAYNSAYVLWKSFLYLSCRLE